MSFDRTRLPDPQTYYEAEGLTLTGKGRWRSAPCPFHGSRNTLRVDTIEGGFCCMAGCGARGGDVLSFHMAQHGVSFVEAARALGCWVDDGRAPPCRPTPLAPRDALALFASEAQYIALMAAHVAAGKPVQELDAHRLRKAASRGALIRGMCT